MNDNSTDTAKAREALAAIEAGEPVVAWEDAKARLELIELHDWDLLIFGGFYCTHCTSDDADEVVPWPCPPLREAGLTDEEALKVIEGAAK